MHVNYLQRYYDNYPEQYIRKHCADPKASEHESSLWGNYSAPVQDVDFLSFVKYEMLDNLKWEFLGSPDYAHDHHYTNFHMDEPGSHLETHNDLKNFRWLITSQVYLDNSNQGVQILDRQCNPVLQIPNRVNSAYFICADPFSWHIVEPLSTLKRSILFRVGKRRHKTVAHYDENEPAWLIHNHKHDDSHYAKLGLRMGNLTEAWLVAHGYKNIYHTDWRQDPSKILKYASKHHESVTVIDSGVFPDLGTYTIQNKAHGEWTAEVVWGKRTDPVLTEAEDILYQYYKNNLHMDYQNIM